MSTIAKIFTVLNLILAAAFLGWAAQALKANQEWRQKYDKSVLDSTAAATAATTERTKLVAEVTEKDKRIQALTSELDGVKNDKARLDTTVADLNAKGAQMQSSLAAISTTLQGIEDSKAQLQKEKDQAEKAQREADTARMAADQAKADAEKMANDLKGQLDTANNSIADKEKALTTKEKERTSLETSLATLQANTHASVSDFASVPDIQAGVLDVSFTPEPGIVSLNVGSNKNVKRGYTFEIYDGKTYKGQVRVEFVHPDMCSAVIVRKVPGQTIHQGDSAATRL